MERLCRAHGISGHETEIAELMQSELEKSCDEVSVDDFGNVVGRKGSGDRTIMLAAHTDSIGLLVKHINKEGYLSFVKIGGIDDRALIGQRVIIKTRKAAVRGIVGSKPPHLMKAEEKKKLVKHDEMFIDVGAKNKTEAEKLVSVGDPIIFEPNYGRLTKNINYGSGLDNRVGCYAMLNVMEKLPKKLNATVYAVGTAQEEVGLKGARVSSYRLNPDVALAIDTTIAGDTPDLKETESSLKLGGGPAITLVEASGRGVITHPKIRETLIKTARKKKIKYQIDVLEGGMTDAAIIYLTREGIPSGSVSIPVRYVHNPTSVFDLRDVDNTIKLVSAAIPLL